MLSWTEKLKSLNNYTILYAEDHEETQQKAMGYLSRHFKAVYLANDGKEALKKYQILHPDILLLDIDMPYMDGLTLTQEIRKTNKTIPILILTAHKDEEKLLRAIGLNLFGYILKPINPNKFRESLYQLGLSLKERYEEYLYFEEGYRWDIKEKLLFQYNKNIFLTNKESLLLRLLLENRGRGVSNEDIMMRLWLDNFDTTISSNSVAQQIAKLRKKFPKNTIQTVYGVGYMIL